jgi:hypothetical protein
MSDSTILPLSMYVRCTGQYVAARPSRNETPGEPEHIKDFKVFLGEIDITEQLPVRDLSELETDFMIYVNGYAEDT